MSLFDAGPQDKHCFTYCGDDRCNCRSAPRYRDRSFDTVENRSVGLEYFEKQAQKSEPLTKKVAALTGLHPTTYENTRLTENRQFLRIRSLFSSETEIDEDAEIPEEDVKAIAKEVKDFCEKHPEIEIIAISIFTKYNLIDPNDFCYVNTFQVRLVIGPDEKAVKIFEAGYRAGLSDGNLDHSGKWLDRLKQWKISGL